MTTLKVPESLVQEHTELFHELRKLAKKSGEMGKAVKNLLSALEPHFKKEEETAMPLLSVLDPLSKGLESDSSEVILLHKKFCSEYPKMLKDHERIKELVAEAKRVAFKERESSAVSLMDALAHHAAIEEEVLYPAAMLVGLFVKERVKTIPQ
jgi:iron-sulfur cluster repair protein YtfE (RIC family)